MSPNKEKQLFQVQNILETLLEATDHFAVLIKNKDLNQSIPMFSSIVEGSQVIMTTLNQTDKSFAEYASTLENYLVLIAKELEQKNMLKMAEIVQFSLRPHFVKIQQAFFEIIGNKKKDKTISIGVFHSWTNPRGIIPEARLNAMLNEAERQKTLLYFFTSTDINFNKNTVNAEVYQNKTWNQVTVPFPNVINNIGAGKISQAERKLRREVPFTSFHVGNKYSLPKRMVKHRKYIDLLVPFRVCINESGIYEFLTKNNRAVFKALGSNRGENIYFINKKGNRYLLLDQKKEIILNEKALGQFINHTILSEKGSYIIQRYIHTRTKADEPYHFRSHVQKNGKGKWQITHIYPRIGNKKSNLSNISTEGRIENFPDFLQREYGENKGREYEKEIFRLSLDIAHHLDKLYGLGICELGLDFAIDDTGQIWMHEANNGPQTAFHEEKRAIHLIAYAKYIAKNGIMYIDSATKTALAKGQFHARTSKLPATTLTDQIVIGVLVGKEHDTLCIPLAKAADTHNVSLYYFTPNDIDFDFGLVKGHFYENESWTAKVTEYPDVIVDCLKMRGHENAQQLYEELADIPCTNEWPIYTSTRSGIFKSIQTNKEIGHHLAPYQIVNRLRIAFQYLERYGQVRLIANNLTSDSHPISIQRLTDNNYLVINNQKSKTYSELSLRHTIQNLIEKDVYIVQGDVKMEDKNGDKAEIHIHLMKNTENDWFVFDRQVETQTVTEDVVEKFKNDLHEYTEQLGIESLLMYKKKLEHVTIDVASTLEKVNTKSIDEMVLILTIDEKQQINILDINLNGPNIISNEESYASTVIAYARSLNTPE